MKKYLWIPINVGLIAIVMAIIGHYGTMGFNLKMFLFFELPLYIFCGWALYTALKIFIKIKE
jgi:hypothetical protein